MAPGPPGAFLPWPRRSQRGFWGGSGFRVGGGGGGGVAAFGFRNPRGWSDGCVGFDRVCLGIC